MKRIGIYISLGIILIISIVFSIWFLPTYLGYCAEKGRILSDKEKIELVIQDILIKLPSRVNSYKVRENGALVETSEGMVENPIPYNNIQDFLKKNPNCCDMQDHIYGEKIPFLLRLTGSVQTYIRIRYKVNYPNPPKEELITEYRALSNCDINRKDQPIYKIERL